MSSELNTKTTENAPQVPSIFINGKEYKQDKLSADCLNAIAVRQDLQANRMRHVVEVEKIDVLTKHYDSKIEKELEAHTKKVRTKMKDSNLAPKDFPKEDHKIWDKIYKKRNSDASYPFSVKNVKEFAEFCENCGGFTIG